MLYTKPIDSISFKDVVDFCNEGNKESFILEYKEEPVSNKQFAKEISAFANTYGGLLIIGVSDESGKPKPPFVGFKPEPQVNYEQRIEQIILSNIRQPIFPVIRVTDEVNGKIFIVIRVPESDTTPHRVDNNRKIYVRTGDISNPIEEADWGKIEWLRDKRKSSIELREFLLIEAEEYFKDAFKKRNVDPNSENYKCILSAKIIPLYPNYSLVDITKLYQIVDSIKSRTDRFWFPYAHQEYRSIRKGLHSIRFYKSDDNNKPQEGEPFEYIYINNYGLLIWKLDMTQLLILEGQKLFKVPVIWIMDFITLFLIATSKFYESLGFWGSSRLYLEFTNLLGVNFDTTFSKQRYNDTLISSDISMFRDEYDLYLPDLREKFIESIKPIAKEVAWAIGCDIISRSNILDAYLNDIKKL